MNQQDMFQWPIRGQIIPHKMLQSHTSMKVSRETELQLPASQLDASAHWCQT